MPWSCRWYRVTPSSAATSEWWSWATRKSCWMTLGSRAKDFRAESDVETENRHRSCWAFGLELTRRLQQWSKPWVFDILCVSSHWLLPALSGHALEPVGIGWQVPGSFGQCRIRTCITLRYQSTIPRHYVMGWNGMERDEMGICFFKYLFTSFQLLLLISWQV